MAGVRDEVAQDRFRDLSETDMTPEQLRVAKILIDGPRKGIRGPFQALLRSPALADRFRQVGDYVRFENSLPDGLRELVILLVARFWSAQYEWNAHREIARQAGLHEAIVNAIGEGRRPPDMMDDETLVYDFVTELLVDKDVSDATYDVAVARFGERTTLDIIATAGYFGFVSLILNAKRHPVPPGGAGLPHLPPGSSSKKATDA